MTRQESFKRKVRARMVKTGERYMAARHQLIEQSARADSDAWTSEPEHSNEAILDATGRDWNEWRRLIDEGPGRNAEHGAIVACVMEEHGVDSWWAQSVTVGYERITGIRLPHQMAMAPSLPARHAPSKWTGRRCARCSSTMRPGQISSPGSPRR